MERILSMRRIAALTIAAAVAAAGACFSERPSTTGPPAGDCRIPVDEIPQGALVTVVRIQGFAFSPAEVRIPRGGTVVWVNCEPEGTEAHTSTSDNGVWSSTLLDTGDVYRRTFEQPGEYPYHCAPHPFMEAKVIVE